MTKGTKIRLAILFMLILTATATGGMSAPAPTKNAVGCSWMPGEAQYGGCAGGSGSCYECIYSDRFGYIKCYETPDGSYKGCHPWTWSENQEP